MIKERVRVKNNVVHKIKLKDKLDQIIVTREGLTSALNGRVPNKKEYFVNIKVSKVYLFGNDIFGQVSLRNNEVKEVEYIQKLNLWKLAA